MPNKYNDIDTVMIERADYFEVSVFLGVGRFQTIEFSDLPTAREGAKIMEAQINNGRRGMVYAVSPEGRSTFVPPSYQPASLIEGETTVTTETKLTGTEIAQLTAAVQGQIGYKRANSKEAAIKRFVAACKAANIAAPNTFLALDFDAAKADLARAVKGEDQGGDAMEIIKPAAKSKAEKPAGKRAAILAAAEAGTLPDAPDFSAETHKRFRPKLAQVVELAEKGDIKGLEAFQINPVSSSPKAIARYRDLCVIALKAQGEKGKVA